MDKKFFHILTLMGLSLAFQSKSGDCRGWLGPDINHQYIPAYMDCWSHCKAIWVSCLTSCGYEVPSHDNSYNLPLDYTEQHLCVKYCYSQREECNNNCSETHN